MATVMSTLPSVKMAPPINSVYFLLKRSASPGIEMEYSTDTHYITNNSDILNYANNAWIPNYLKNSTQ